MVLCYGSLGSRPGSSFVPSHRILESSSFSDETTYRADFVEASPELVTEGEELEYKLRSVHMYF